MATKVIIANTVYTIPSPGDNHWAEQMTDWAIAVTEALASMVGPFDILARENSLSNNVTTPLPVAGLYFDSTVVQRILVEGTITKVYPEVLARPTLKTDFEIRGVCANGQVEYSQSLVGDDIGVYLTVGNEGQFYYTSDDDPDVENIYIKFQGKAIAEESDE